MNAVENTTFALVWTACTISMVQDITKRVQKARFNHRLNKVSRVLCA